MKQFVTSNTGASQCLTPTVDEKVKIYDNYTTAVSCIACLAEGEIVATKSSNLLDMDTVKSYVADQLKLSDPVDITSCVTTSSTTFEAPYDGNLYIKGYGPIGSNVSVTVNGTQINTVQSPYNNSWITASGAVSKGDTVKLLAENTNCYVAYAQWYCDRYYN